MNITTNKSEAYFQIELDGDLDASSCLLLDNAIANAIQEGEKSLIIDCKKLQYISSAGLGVFMSYIQDFEESKTKMILFGLADKVYNVFRILGLDELLKIVDSQEEAIQVAKI
ncbi:MAG: anti-sigma factor antagonist [Cytophagales bacterium]|nr:MAG: anti-sigma factor antagonist [Cytophagales bacterium]